jgi:hypothetical protein
MLACSGHLEPKAFLLPFVHILGSRTISGPYVRNALDAIQALLACDVFKMWEATAVTEALRQVALTVIRYKIHALFHQRQKLLTGFDCVQLQVHSHGHRRRRIGASAAHRDATLPARQSRRGAVERSDAVANY